MIPEQPGMQPQQPMHQMPDGSMMPGATHGESAQQEVDPQVMQITELFSTSIQEGGKPHDVVISLIEQQVDQNVIGQALMQLGMEQEAIVQLFQEVQKMQQPQPPTAEQINNNPQQISRAEDMQKEAPAMDMNITSMDQAKSGIEIKPENRGKFTRWAKARGMTVPEAANKVMSNTEAYPPSVVKMANFAKNAAGFKKQEGGSTSWNWKGKTYSGTLIPSMETETNRYARTENGKIKTLPKKQGGGQSFIPEGVTYSSDAFDSNMIPEENVGAYSKTDGYTNYPVIDENGKYYGRRNLKAATGVETSTANDGASGQENLNMMNSFLSNVTVTDTSQPKPQPNPLAGNMIDRTIKRGEDEGILEPGPMYVNPAIYNQGKFNLGNAANALLSGYETMFSGRDSDGDGVKDGSFRDWKGKAVKNKLNKVANATYDVQLDLSDENKNAAAEWFKQFQIENPDALKQKDELGNIIANEAEQKINEANAPSGLQEVSANLIQQWKDGSAATKAYIESILKQKGQSIPTEEDEVVETEKEEVLRNGGSLPRAQYALPDTGAPFADDGNPFPLFRANEQKKADQAANANGAPVASDGPLEFKDWVMQDSVRRSGADAPQLYAEYVANFNAAAPDTTTDEADATTATPTAADLYKKIDTGSVDVSYGGVGGFLDRAKNSTVATAFGDLSDFAVKGAGVVNDYFDQIAQDDAMQDMRVSMSADNIYGTKTDAFNKRGTFDINTGIMGSEGDATTGLYMSKQGGGVNNPGFKALPPAAQHNILSNMAYGGEEGAAAYLANRDRVIKREMAKAGDGKEYRKAFNNAGGNFSKKETKYIIQNMIDNYGFNNETDTIISSGFSSPARGNSRNRALSNKMYDAGYEGDVDNNNIFDVIPNKPFTMDQISFMSIPKNQKGGEIVQVDSRMLAKLIAAGADIEKL